MKTLPTKCFDLKEEQSLSREIEICYLVFLMDIGFHLSMNHLDGEQNIKPIIKTKTMQTWCRDCTNSVNSQTYKNQIMSAS